MWFSNLLRWKISFFSVGIPFNFPPPDPPDLLHKQAAEQILKQAQVEVNEVDSSDLPDDLKSSQKYRIMKLAFDDVIEESKSYRDVFKVIHRHYMTFMICVLNKSLRLIEELIGTKKGKRREYFRHSVP